LRRIHLWNCVFNFLQFYSLLFICSFVQGILVDIHVIIWSKIFYSVSRRGNCPHDWISWDHVTSKLISHLLVGWLCFAAHINHTNCWWYPKPFVALSPMWYSGFGSIGWLGSSSMSMHHWVLVAWSPSSQCYSMSRESEVKTCPL